MGAIQPSPGLLQGFQAVAVAPLSALTLSRLLAALEAGAKHRFQLSFLGHLAQLVEVPNGYNYGYKML